MSFINSYFTKHSADRRNNWQMVKTFHVFLKLLFNLNSCRSLSLCWESDCWGRLTWLSPRKPSPSRLLCFPFPWGGSDCRLCCLIKFVCVCVWGVLVAHFLSLQCREKNSPTTLVFSELGRAFWPVLASRLWTQWHVSSGPPISPLILWWSICSKREESVCQPGPWKTVCRKWWPGPECDAMGLGVPVTATSSNRRWQAHHVGGECKHLCAVLCGVFVGGGSKSSWKGNWRRRLDALQTVWDYHTQNGALVAMVLRDVSPLLLWLRLKSHRI